jgi:prophage regulatory protein
MTIITKQRLLLTRDDLPQLGIKISNSTMLRLEATGEFPTRVRIGKHSVAWLAHEIFAHVDRIAEAREVQ